VRGRDPNAPRTIDLDLVVYDEVAGEVAGRTIPSADITERAFVAIPLAELAPALRVPRTGARAADIARGFAPAQGDMILQTRITEELRAMTKEIPESAGAIEAAVQSILAAIGEDPEREGLVRTPERIARMYAELTAGYHIDPRALLNDALFEVEYDEMVLVKDIEFYSLCEHHLLPFFGRAHVAYMPRERVVGLSKIPRIVDMFARRLQVQERMTTQIADLIDEVVTPAGVAVVVEGLHLCAAMRGVSKPGAVMVTSAMRGSFRDNAKTRAELLGHLGRDKTIAL
jgi:GTP cyclohydrolase I